MEIPEAQILCASQTNAEQCFFSHPCLDIIWPIWFKKQIKKLQASRLSYSTNKTWFGMVFSSQALEGRIHPCCLALLSAFPQFCLSPGLQNWLKWGQINPDKTSPYYQQEQPTTPQTDANNCTRHTGERNSVLIPCLCQVRMCKFQCLKYGAVLGHLILLMYPKISS